VTAPTAGPAGPSSFRAATLHLLALWSVAVAQPLYDIVRRNREFFVAHRAEPADLLLLVLIVSIVLPGIAAVLIGGLGVASKRVGRAVHLAAVATLVAAIAAQPLAQYAELPAVWHYATAAAIGIAGAWLYASAAPTRLFVSVLSPAVAVFPAVLLLHPDMAAFVRPSDRTRQVAGTIPGTPPPIVMIVFDQLPLTSLMTADGRIDAARFPGFAALSNGATWYRNATTVADYTGFALPPIVTGLRPRARHLPVAEDYPDSLFTFLEGTYRFEVFEAITGLCPQRLCGRESASSLGRAGAMTLDLAVVYLHVVLHADQRAALPALTDDWKNFAQGQNWHRRWVAERDDDRRRAPRLFLDAIDGTRTQPTLYFLHALLPHEPYMYLPGGQQFTARPQLTGLLRREHWTTEEWAVAEQYRRHLIQLQYVDGLLADIVHRLKAQRLFDRSLVIVTADHGVSFRPGGSFKSVRPATLEDIMPVPLFIKTPGQREGAVIDLNVESPDIVPTVGDLLGATLTWKPDGRSVRQGGARPSTKTIHHTGARREIAVSAEELAARRQRAVDRKIRLFGSEKNSFWVPTTAPYRELIGRPLATLAVDERSSLQVLVRDTAQFRNVDLDAAVLPLELTGRVANDAGEPAQATLAVAVNGTVAGTTRTFGFLRGSAAGTWAALIDARYLRPGRNSVDLLVVSGRNEGVRMERAFTSSDRPPALNLVSRTARDYWGVEQAGLYDPEGGPILHRWTTGEAVLVVPFDVGSRPRSLRVGLAQAPAEGRLHVELNACTVFDGAVDSEPWYRTFSLGQCPQEALTLPEARIVLRSPTHMAGIGSSARTVGVAVETVNLLPWEWPLRPQAAEGRLEARLLGDDAPHIRGSVAMVELANRGETVLLSPLDSREAGIDLELRWAGAAGATQRLPLPRTLYPTERITAELPLMPPPVLEGRAPWTVNVVAVARGGRTIALEAPCVVRVVAEE
jgi:hypothetical protein